MATLPALNAYATDDQTRTFVRGLSAADLAEWARQQELGATQARVTEDRASYTRGAEMARQEIERRNRPAGARRTVTRQPEHPGYDNLGDADRQGEDFHLLINGHIIGGTYWASADYVKDGERWVSYGPAGYSFEHRTREDAEQAQLKAAGLAGATVTTVAGPAPEPEPAPLPVTWEQALAEAKKKGVGRCSDPAAMAAFCDANITLIVGAVSGQLIWEGAMRKGMTLLELGRLANRDPIACSELMWA